MSVSRRTIPNELLYRILMQAIAHSIHSICISPGDVEWEMNILPTLCRVSYSFRAITLELTHRAFHAKPAQGNNVSSIFPPIARQLQRLRLFGLRLHHPSRYTSHFEPLPEDALIVFGYSMFLSAMDLRSTSIGGAVQSFKPTQEIILLALSASLLICPKVEPLGMADVLYSTMSKQIDLVGSGLDIVRATEELSRLMEAQKTLEHLGSEDRERQRVEILSRIHIEIGKLKAAGEVYVKIVECDQIFQPLELPGVVSVIKELQKAEFEGLDYDTSQRFNSLLLKWDAA